MRGMHFPSLRDKFLTYREQKWEQDKLFLERENKIKEEKKIMRTKRLTTAKLLVFFLFLNCSLIEIFTAYVTIKSFDLAFAMGIAVDFTPLNTLIGTVVAEVIGYAIYALKSMKENCKGGIVYETAMSENNTEEEFV